MAAQEPSAIAEAVPGADAIRLLEFVQVGPDRFCNRFSEIARNDHLFGGQVLAQALAAASRTVEGRRCHSMHAYFLRAGSARRRIAFEVERTRDGGRFSTRRVVASQGDRAIFHMECSFHDAEAGLAHQVATLPDVPPPESLADIAAMPVEGEMDGLGNIVVAARLFPLLQVRLVDHERMRTPDPSAHRQFWVRVPSAAGCDDPAIQQALLAYLSDFLFSGAALLPHPIQYRSPRLSVASLDHAMWFHHPPHCDDWLLYDCDGLQAGEGRGLTRGLLLDRAGRLIASVVQEALFRPKAALE